MSWNSPFSLPGNWFKGNLHTHTTQSDGLLTPEKAIEWYREHGYDFLALTDHWVYTPGQSFAPADDFVTLPGDRLHGPGYHLLALGLSGLPDRALEEPQALVDAVLATGGLPFFAHPYWTGQTSADIAPIEGTLGIEVFNTVCEKTRGLGYSSVYWDDLLASGKRLWGLAVDDVHWKHGSEGQGFVMVRAESLSDASILEAIRQGRFYSSTGPKINDLRVVRQADGELALRVHCSPCSSIVYYASGPTGRRFEASPDALLDGATLPIRPEQVYLRVECRDHAGRIAWSNPVFVEDVLEG